MLWSRHHHGVILFQLDESALQRGRDRGSRAEQTISSSTSGRMAVPRAMHQALHLLTTERVRSGAIYLWFRSASAALITRPLHALVPYRHETASQTDARIYCHRWTSGTASYGIPSRFCAQQRDIWVLVRTYCGNKFCTFRALLRD